jgi:hypothetical protein
MNGTFEEEVLEMCSDDYEAPHSITADLSREMKRPVTEADVRTALVSLALAGKLQAYVFEESTSRYLPISSANATNTSGIWFRRIVNGQA